MSPSAPKVLVAGAGPSGLIAALSLLENGVPVRIIAKEEAFRPGQRGSGISARTLEVYNFLGVKEVPEQALYLFDVLEHAKGSAEVHSVKTMQAWNEPTPGCPWRTYLMMGQNAAEEILRSHLAKYGCEVELGTSLVSFEQDSERVTAILSKNENGKESTETIEVDWLVGADGARGVTRKALKLTFLGETHHNENLVTGDVEIKGFPMDGWHNFGDRASQIVTFKPSEKLNGFFQFFIMGPSVDHHKLSVDRAALHDFFSEMSGLPKEAFGEVEWVTDYRPNFRMVNKFGEGRVFVVGDAAHVHSPMGGQGMNSSAQDSFNLGWKLALVAKGNAPPSLLQSYTDERIPVIAEMLNVSKGLQKEMVDQQTKDPWLRGETLLQLGVNYRGSGIVVDETEVAAGASKAVSNSYTNDGTVRGGDRAPDAPVLLDMRSPLGLATTRFFDIFKPTEHTVLIFTSAVPDSQFTAILDGLKKYPASLVQSAVVRTREVYNTNLAGLELATLVLKDKLGNAYKGYNVAPLAQELTIFIIRPDGYVGGLVKGVAGIHKYFERILI